MPSQVRKLLAAILFCEPDMVGNVLLHIPVGGIIAYAFFLAGWLGFGMILLFIRYETTERKVLGDKCYPDLQGALWGLVLVGIPLFTYWRFHGM